VRDYFDRLDLGLCEKLWCYFVILICIVFAVLGTLAVVFSPID
jgi:hypothetical protein